MNKGIISLMICVALLIISGCTPLQTEETQQNIPQVTPPKTTEINVANPNEPNAIGKIKDLPLEKIVTPLSIKDAIEHRSALNGKIITVKGYVVFTLLGEEACPTNKENGMTPSPQGCAEPRIMLADTQDEDRDTSYDLLVLVAEAENDLDYKIGQSVEITGQVDASPSAIVLRKVYKL